MSDLTFFVLSPLNLILDGPICKSSKIGVETNRGGKSISAIHVNIYISKRKCWKQELKKNTASVNTVLVSTTKLDINQKISLVFYLKLGFPGTTIQIVRVPGNNIENSNQGKKCKYDRSTCQ